mmetsp:Transcript_9825/g.13575  ORF Transcript_9825/g.13575 Transcript_9825/m.13575 type:complete len:411 (+) Transcript_9825:102-1334(+)
MRSYVYAFIAAGLVLVPAAVSKLFTFECCVNSDADLSGFSVGENLAKFSFVPLIGWIEAKHSLFVIAVMLMLTLIVFSFIRLLECAFRCCCKGSKFWSAFTVLLAVLVGFVRSERGEDFFDRQIEVVGGTTAAKLVFTSLLFCRGDFSSLSSLYREYVSPGFWSEEHLALQVEAASFFDNRGAEIILPTMIPVLNSTQCKRTLDSIHKLRDYWKHANVTAGPFPMFTLGHASYLHGNRTNLNFVLQKEFEWLYDIVIHSLENYLGDKVYLKEGANLPGFHLYLSSFVWGFPVARVHSDIQYSDQFQTDESHSLGSKKVISFTLPIHLPLLGSHGLFTYTANQTSPELKVRKFPKFVREMHPYKVGHLVIHGGLLIHQIAPSFMGLPGDGRITLQGHGFYDSELKSWALYW